MITLMKVIRKIRAMTFRNLSHQKTISSYSYGSSRSFHQSVFISQSVDDCHYGCHEPETHTI